MRRQLLPSVVMVLVFTVLCGLAYPLAVTGFAQVLFHGKANGSIVKRDGQPACVAGTQCIVGSGIIGQSFARPEYFHPRPSAAGDGYDASASAGSNKGPTNPEFLTSVQERVAAYRAENGLAADTRVPVDAVTASASGLDPHISLANARLQAARVAGARELALDRVLRLIHDHTDPRALGVLGEPGVNVLELNLSLDRLHA